VFQDVVSKELLNDFQKSKAIPEELGQEEKSTTARYDHFLTLTILRNRDTTAVRARIELQGCCSKRTNRKKKARGTRFKCKNTRTLPTVDQETPSNEALTSF
jgi:hypothetical protein